MSSSTINYFAEIDEFGTDASTGDPLAEWFGSPPIPIVSDTICWWTAMGKTGNPLAQMALDFLSTPG